jgi:hypothetical protein
MYKQKGFATLTDYPVKNEYKPELAGSIGSKRCQTVDRHKKAPQLCRALGIIIRILIYSNGNDLLSSAFVFEHKRKVVSFVGI